MRRIIDNPPILDDEKYLYCISLASLSRNDRRNDERYGSILMKESQIIGKGFNRAITHPTFKLERTIRQGWTNHAEIEALNDALSKDFDIKDSDLYVAGYFLDSGYLFLQQRYTCVKCPPYLQKYGIDNIHIPTPDGWERKPLDLAIEEAEEFRGGAYKERQHERIGNYTIDIIKDMLLKPSQLGFPQNLV